METDWGGTNIEAWSDPAALAECGAGGKCNEDAPQRCDSRLWNAMVEPLQRNSVAGFLWYQGESNSGMSNGRDLYNCTFPAMVRSWRQHFSDNSATSPSAPFGFVQLAALAENSINAGFPVIRWHQTADMGYVPNSALPDVFMAVAMDTFDPKEGYPGGIHPRQKQAQTIIKLTMFSSHFEQINFL